MKRIKDKVAEEIEVSLVAQEALEIFQQAGWGEDARWLSSLVLPVVVDHAATRDGTIDGVLAHPLKVVARAWQDAGPLPDRDRALLIAYVRVCGCGGKDGCLGRVITQETRGPDDGYVTTTTDQRRQLAEEFRRERPHAGGADFEGALVRTGWPGDYRGGDTLYGWMGDRRTGLEATGRMPPADRGPEAARLMHLLIDDAGLDLAKVLDLGELVAAAVNGWPLDFGEEPRQPVMWDSPLTLDNPRSLGTWVAGLGPRAILNLLPGLEASDDQQAGAVALGVRRVIERWLFSINIHPTHFHRAGGVLAAAAHPWFEFLHRRHQEAKAPCASLRRAWLWFAWCRFSADLSAWKTQDEAVRKAVLHAANEEIARARKIFVRAGPSAPKAPEPPAEPDREAQRPAAEEFAWARDLLSTCSMVLFELGGVWHGLKPMLLAWRALTAPAVATDLRYWPEPGRDQPPSPWSELVLWPINMFHHVVGREQKLEPTLEGLRAQIASFCLERLTDRLSEKQRKAGRPRTNEDMVESSPGWRYCLIRAASSLGVNPEGKGHRILHKSMQIDPYDEVREAAKDAYERIRRNVGLPEGVSPRRAVMSALWWLRQGHLLGLGIEPDRDGAQRTRIKELTRTKESEQRDSLPHDQQI